MINIYIYGMSHALSIINCIINNNSKIGHHNYSENNNMELIVNHGVHSIEGVNINLYSSIFHPKLIKKYGGIAYYDSNSKLIKNENLLNLLKNEMNSCNINYSVGFINGNEHNVSTMTNNRFEVDFNMHEYSQLNSNTSKEIVPESLIKSQVVAWSRGTYAIYDSLADVIPGDKFYSDPPPPVENLDEIILIYNEHFRDDAKMYGVVEANIRMKIYILYVNSLFNNNKINYKRLKSPIMKDGPMYLPENLIQGVTHGNIYYAQKIINYFIKEI